MTAFWVVEPRRWRLRLIFWTISSVFSRRCPSGISTLLQLPTEVGDRYGFLVIVVIDLLYVIPGVILLICSEKNKLKASVERYRPAARLLPHVKTRFVQFFSFKRVNYAVEDSSIWLSKYLVFFFQLSHIERSWTGVHEYWFPVVFVWPLIQSFSIFFELF